MNEWIDKQDARSDIRVTKKVKEGDDRSKSNVSDYLAATYARFGFGSRTTSVMPSVANPLASRIRVTGHKDLSETRESEF
jgi:hypothetical protein